MGASQGQHASAPFAEPPAVPAQSSVPAADRAHADFHDRPLVLGRDGNLVAISTTPTAGVNPDLPVVVILNTGVVHRVGHHRMFVTLSRMLAARGYRVLRFDQSGLGDSGRRNDSLPPIQAIQADIGEVLSWLEDTHSAQRFILVGLCAGADHALIRGSTDRRVVGTVLIDPTVPHTRRYFAKHMLRRLLSIRSWVFGLRNLSLTFGKMRKIARGSQPDDRSSPTTYNYDDAEVRNFLGNAYQSLVEADDQILAVFTGGIEFQHNYREQLLDAFPQVDFSRHLKLVYYGDSDHTFTWERHRNALFRLILDWTEKVSFREADPVDPEDQEVSFI